MAATNQDFTTFSGDQRNIVFTVTDGPNGTGNPVDLSTCTNIVWKAARNFDDQTTIVLTKSLQGGGITLVGGGTGGKFMLSLSPTDSAALTLTYAYMAITYDDLGNPVTVAVGQWTVKPKPTASYSGDPAQSTRDFVRALVGDTDIDSPLFSDQIYDQVITQFGGPLYSAAQVCRMLGAQYSQKASKRVGDLSIQYGEIATNYRNMAAEYQAQADRGGVGIYTAGISKSDRNSYRSNPDAIGAFTTIHAFDNRGGTWGGFLPNNVDEE